MLTAKRSAGVLPEVDLRECTLHSPLQKWIRQNPLWLWNPEVSSEIQNRGASGPKIGHVCVSGKTFKKYRKVFANIGDLTIWRIDKVVTKRTKFKVCSILSIYSSWLAFEHRICSVNSAMLGLNRYDYLNKFPWRVFIWHIEWDVVILSITISFCFTFLYNLSNFQ